MKETLIKLLTTKFVGVSDKIIEGIADKHSKTITTEEAAKTFVEDLTIQNIIESYADQRADGASKTAVANYEKKHGLKEGKPVEPPTPPTPQPPQPEPTGGEAPAWAQALLDANAKLAAKVDALEKGKVTDTRTAQFSNLIKGLTETQKKAYQRINISDMSDEDFTTLCAEVTEEVKTLETETRSQQATSTPPSFGAPKAGEASAEEVKAMLERIK